MHFRHVARAALVAGTCLLTATATAQGSDAARQGPQLNPVVVTATRIPQRHDQTLAATTVITRTEIERLQPRSVQELLRWVPGVSISNQGGPGKLTSIFIRGTNSDQTLVLINGVRYTSATAGIPAIADIPVSHIKRIEIVRGPRSSLYGADAIGGVIQIFTLNGSAIDSGVQPYITIGGGSNDTYSAVAGISGSNEVGHFNLTVSRKDTDGFNACRGKPFPNGGGCFADQPDNDGYQRTAVSVRGGFNPVDQVEISLHALRVDAEVAFDGPAVNHADSVRQVLGATISGFVSPSWRMQLSIGHENSDVDNYKNGEFVSSFETTINTVSWQNDFLLSQDQRVILGVDYRGVHVGGTVDYEQSERDTLGVFVQYLARFGDHQLQLALRGDDREAFDDSITGSVNYGWHIDSVHTLTLSYGTAYNVPTFNDLYYPASQFGDFSNADLKPEESVSYELGFTADRDWGQWAVYVYQTEIDDVIILDSNFFPRNISKARIRGAEASINVVLGPWYVNASASWVDAENRSDGPSRGNQLPRRPQYSAKLRVTRQFGRFSFGGSVKYGGSRFDGAANDFKLDDFVLVGLRASWNVTDAIQIQASIDNLFDAEYETVRYYNQPGRRFFLSVSYRP